MYETFIYTVKKNGETLQCRKENETLIFNAILDKNMSHVVSSFIVSCLIIRARTKFTSHNVDYFIFITISYSKRDYSIMLTFSFMQNKYSAYN